MQSGAYVDLNLGIYFVVGGCCRILIWFQFKNQADKADPSVEQNQLQEKVHHLEENLKKTLEIMQDLAKKMHVQQEVIEQTTSKLQKVELQNAELVSILAKAVQPER